MTSIDVPKWALGITWYQIMPERFRNGDPNNSPRASDQKYAWPHDHISPLELHPWGSDWYQLQPYEQKNGKDIWHNLHRRRYGGDLLGIIDQLDYLQDLGIEALYLNPVFQAPSHHKYDAASYHHVDPAFGPDPAGDRQLIAREVPHDPSTWEWTSADEMLLRLIEQVHQRNMYIILDGVFNHMGLASWVYQDILRNQKQSPFSGWMNVESWADEQGRKTKSGAKPDSKPGSESGSESGSEFDSEPGSKSERNFDPDSKSDSKINSNHCCNTKFNSESNSKSERNSDADFNHDTASDHKSLSPLMAELDKKYGSESPFRPGFAVKTWEGFLELPEWRQERRGIVDGPRDYIFNITRRWMDPFGNGDTFHGVDGWRLDVAYCIKHPFWKAWRRHVKAINPEAYLVAEVIDSTKKTLPYVKGDEFDAAMNYNFQFACDDFFIRIPEQRSASGFADRLEQLMSAYPHPVAHAMQNLLGSHDTDRLASRIVNRRLDPGKNWWDYFKRSRADNPDYQTRKPNNMERRIHQLMVFAQFTLPGAPMIFYGDEAGMWGANDPCCRKPMLWPDMEYDPERSRPDTPLTEDSNSEVLFDQEMHRLYNSLISARKSCPALKYGEYTTLLTDDSLGVLVFRRRYRNQDVIVALRKGICAEDDSHENKVHLNDGNNNEEHDNEGHLNKGPVIENGKSKGHQSEIHVNQNYISKEAVFRVTNRQEKPSITISLNPLSAVILADDGSVLFSLSDTWQSYFK